MSLCAVAHAAAAAQQIKIIVKIKWFFICLRLLFQVAFAFSGKYFSIKSFGFKLLKSVYASTTEGAFIISSIELTLAMPTDFIAARFAAAARPAPEVDSRSER